MRYGFLLWDSCCERLVYQLFNFVFFLFLKEIHLFLNVPFWDPFISSEDELKLINMN